MLIRNKTNSFLFLVFSLILGLLSITFIWQNSMWVWSELMFLCCSLYCLLYAVVRGVIGDRTTALKQSSVGAIITVLLAIFLGPIISHSWPINWFSVYSHPVFVTYLNSLVSPLLILGLVMVSLIVIAIYTFPPEFARKRKRTTRSRKPTQTQTDTHPQAKTYTHSQTRTLGALLAPNDCCFVF